MDLSAPLAEHSLHVFHAMEGLAPDKAPATKLSDLFNPADTGNPVIFPSDQIPALQGRYGADDVWRTLDAAGNSPGADLHPFARQLLDGHQPELAAIFGLTDRARQAISKANLYTKDADPAVRSGKRMHLVLRKAETRRIAAAGVELCRLILRIETVRLTVFATGQAFAESCLRFEREDGAPISAIELNEAVIAASRINKIVWLLDDGAEVEGEGFTLGLLIRRLVLGAYANSAPHHRTATMVFARFDKPADMAGTERYSVMLARRYSTDYYLPENPSGAIRLRPFVNVHHTAALEGAATVIAPTPEAPELPNFLKDFGPIFRQNYVPALLLALHEHRFLLNATTASVTGARTESLPELRRLREADLVFRLCYRFPQISQIGMHNDFYHACRKAFGSDDLLGDLSSDVASVETHLRAVTEEDERRAEAARHRRFYWASVIGGAALAGLTSYTIVKEVYYVLAEDKKLAGLIGLGVGTAIVLVSTLIGFLKRPPRHDEGHHGHLTVHAMIEHMIKRNL